MAVPRLSGYFSIIPKNNNYIDDTYLFTNLNRCISTFILINNKKRNNYNR